MKRDHLVVKFGVVGILLAARATLMAQPPDTQLRYRVYYQCNGERLLVDHCRKDDDGKGFGPPTTPRENYCLVYYPDRPRRHDIMVQAAEPYDDIVKKLQACGALAGSSTTNTQSSNRASAGAASAIQQARTYYAAKDYSNAIAVCQKVLAVEPNNADALNLLGMSLTPVRRYQEAIVSLQHALQVQPKNPGYLYNLGDAYFFSKDYPKATSAYESAVAAKPDADFAADAYQWIGESFYHQKKYDPAAKAFLQSLKMKPDNASVLYELGLNYLDAGRSADAETNFLHTLRLSPNHVSANYYLGWIYDDRLDPEKAVPYLETALRANPKFSLGHRELGYAYFQLKQYPDAEAETKQELQAEPKDTLGWYLLGEIYVSMGKKMEAMHVYNTLLSLDRQKAADLKQLMNRPPISARQGAPAGTTTRNTPEVLNPNAPYIRQLMVLGTLQDSQGHPDEALEAYQRALALNPDKDTRATIYAYEGSAYDDLKQYDKAVTAYLECLRVHPTDNHAKYMLGLVYVEMGKKAEATQVYQMLVSVDKPEAQDLHLRIKAMK
jgi:tetratricopeptide (TPR) repeat protein